MHFTTQTANKKKDLTVKFYFDEEDKKSWVELKFMSKEAKEKAYKEIVVEEIDFQLRPDNNKLEKVVTPQFEVTDIEDWYLDNQIVNWEGLFLDKVELKPTKENKVKLYREQPAFAAFLNEKIGELEEIALESFGGDSEIKNSLST